MRKVIFHYYRPDHDYDPWGLWVWPEGYGGRLISFSGEDSYGKTAQISYPKEHRRIGFLIRGASWEKDIAHDRYIDQFIDNVGEVWLVAGDSNIYYVPPVHLRREIRAFDQVELTVHYYRYDNDYKGWNVWVWTGTEWGRALEFTGEDCFGKIAQTVFSQQTDAAKIGLIVRKSSAGSEWQSKDGPDRELPLFRAAKDGRLSVWLMQDDPNVYYCPGDVARKPRLTAAVLDDVNQIHVRTHLPILSGEANMGFWLFCGDEPVDIAEVRPLGPDWQRPLEALIKTAKPLDLKKQHKVKHSTHGSQNVTFGGIFTKPVFPRLFHYGGSDLGAVYSRVKTTFKVWSPTAERMAVVTYAAGEGGEGEVWPMRRAKKGTWALSLPGDLDGVYYNYLVTNQGRTKEAVDPYARAAGVNGLRGQVLDLQKTNPPGWAEMRKIPLKDPVDAVIYEVHIRDFTGSPTSGAKARGQYLGFIEEGTETASGLSTGLDHLKDLGITHVHLLPIFDFATVDEADPKSGYNWGYDPQNYNVPEGSYSSDPYDGRVRVRELKEMILGLNKAGIGVIMDVVYNHTFHSIDSSLNRLAPFYYYRTNRDGSFSNGSGCGNELADERSMVRKLIVDSVCYWAREYKIAGFRFDLMGLHHIDTMRAIREALDKINPNILIYGEGWAAGASTLPEHKRALKENTPLLPKIASFCSDLRDGIKGHVFHNHDRGFIQGGGREETVKFGIAGAVSHPQIDYRQVLYSNSPWALAPSQSVSYAEAHDNLTLWDKLLCTTAPEEEFARIAMMKLAHTLILTSQGIPFLHAGQEFARTKGGDPNSYQSPDHVNQINWERKGEFFELYEYTRGLIKLRKKHAAFRLRTAKEVREKLKFLKMPAPNMLGFALGPFPEAAYESILVFINSNRAPLQIKIPAGRWQILADREGVGPGPGILTGPLIWLDDLSPLILGKKG